ncbi:MAG: hypothetical protein V3U55_08245 [Mycobacterium sp.]
MRSVPAGTPPLLDLRLVPAALTSWVVTAAGILWAPVGSLVGIVVMVVATAAAGWWGSRGGRPDYMRRRFSGHSPRLFGLTVL